MRPAKGRVPEKSDNPKIFFILFIIYKSQYLGHFTLFEIVFKAWLSLNFIGEGDMSIRTSLVWS